MPLPVNKPKVTPNGTRYRFHPLVRSFMLAIGLVTGIYAIYFIVYMIPTAPRGVAFFKIFSVVILYIAFRTVYNHLTSLNSVIIRPDSMEFRFLLKKNIRIPWNRLQKMEIFKAISHYWRTTYTDEKGHTKTYKTSLAFPGIMQLLMSIEDHVPDLEMNELLKQVLIYKRSLAEGKEKYANQSTPSEPETKQ